MSSVRTSPPSIVDMWCEKKVENVLTRPKVPVYLPLNFAPIDSQLSSNRIRSLSLQIFSISSNLQGLPSMLTATITRVFFVTAFRKASMS